MTRARTFSKAEIMDAARAAAETGMSAILRPTGDIEFLHTIISLEQVKEAATADGALDRWMNEGRTRRRA